MRRIAPLVIGLPFLALLPALARAQFYSGSNSPSPVATTIHYLRDQPDRTTESFSEPDVVFFPEGWNGYKYWMVATPLPIVSAVSCDLDETAENPCLLVSNDGRSWNEPAPAAEGAPRVNPLVRPPIDGINSDPCIEFARDSLVLYYNQTFDHHTGPHPHFTRIVRLASADGVTWPAAPVVVVDEMINYAVSPAVVTDEATGVDYLWYVRDDFDSTGCASPRQFLHRLTSLDGGFSWSADTLCAVTDPFGGPLPAAIWHVNVERRGGTYRMLWAGYRPAPQCGKADLYYATSADGITWVAPPAPILTKSCGWDNGAVYRAAFATSGDFVRIWYSGHHSTDASLCRVHPDPYRNCEWHLGYSEGALGNPAAATFSGSNAGDALDLPALADGDVTHPDIVDAPDRWHGYAYWMAMATRSGGGQPAGIEIVASNDCAWWIRPPGATEGAVQPPPGGFAGDPDLLIANDSLVIVYRETLPAEGSTRLERIASADGAGWSPPAVLLEHPGFITSPAVVLDGGLYHLWYLLSSEACPSAASRAHHRTSVDGLNWSEADTVRITASSGIPAGFDVRKDGPAFRMLYTAFAAGTACTSTSLYHATSTDGVAWTSTSNPILAPSGCEWDNAAIDRATFLTRGTHLRIWYGGRHTRLAGCGPDPDAQDQSRIGATEGCLPGGDCLPPAPVCDLRAIAGCRKNQLMWTAPGDDGTSGWAAGYDLRGSKSQIVESNFAAATPVWTEAPLTSGSAELANDAAGPCGLPHYYALKTRDAAGNWSRISNVISAVTGCASAGVDCSDDFGSNATTAYDLSLREPAPNPARVTATLDFTLPSGEAGKRYELSLYDIAGRRVATLESGSVTPGPRRVTWDLRAAGGARVRGGVYFLRLTTGARTIARTMIVL